MSNYYIWHGNGLCDNATDDLMEALVIEMALNAEGHEAFIEDADHMEVPPWRLQRAPDDAIEAAITVADWHGEDDDPDHTVGDLQDLLREAWKAMTVEQKLRFMRSETVRNHFETGGRSDFENVEMAEEMLAFLRQVQASLEHDGYTIVQASGGVFSWVSDDAAGEDFSGWSDAVWDAWCCAQNDRVAAANQAKA